MSGVFNAPIYGHNTWGSLFTPRQALALITFAHLVRSVGQHFKDEKDVLFVTAIESCLALSLDRLADRCSSLCSYDPNPTMSGINHTFTRQALPMMWDLAEGDPPSDRSGGWGQGLNWIISVLKYEAQNINVQGAIERASATSHPLPDDVASAFVTDPPYYNAVPYADLSDYFYVWLKRTLKDAHPDLFSDDLAPKDEEICEMAGWDSDRYQHKDKEFFEQAMCKAMGEGRRVLNPSGIGIVVFAHKSTSGWEALLQAMIDAGWTITGSWAIDTEMGTRLRARGSAVLASSVHLVCRPRENEDGTVREDEIGDWRDILQELPRRIHEWMPRLAHEGVVGADAIFACLGPALEIFSRYSRVEKASGEAVPLKEYLEHVWAAVAKEALNMIFAGADATGFEEDARLTAMWMWTLSTEQGKNNGNGIANDGDGDESDDETSDLKKKKTSGFSLEYDAARKIAQGLGAYLEKLNTLVEVKGDTARLLGVGERTRYLFGKDESQAQARRKKSHQLKLGFIEELEEAEAEMGKAPRLGATTLDRVHQAMILFAAGRAESMKRFLVEEGAGNDTRFWRLAQALSALYPATSDEKRWVDGVLARKKGLGF
jgi:adenine-specific DNA methylase